MYKKSSEQRICQGDIFENFNYKLFTLEDSPKITLSITFGYIIILTQDCDLEWDYKSRTDNTIQTNDKFLQSILFCPCYIAENFKEGQHLSSLGLTMTTWGGEQWKSIKQNQHERFHFLRGDDDFKLPNLTVDFKHFYTIDRGEIYGMYKNKYVASLSVPFREHISQRFAYYLSRIGLPTSQND